MRIIKGWFVMVYLYLYMFLYLLEDNNVCCLLYVFGVIVGFMLVEVVGGFFFGFLVLLVDVGYMLIDIVVLLFALFVV